MPVLRTPSVLDTTANITLPRLIVRLAGRVLVALIVLFCVLLLTIRFFVFPQIESYRGRITATLERQIGQPVELGGLAGEWDGWNPRLDIKSLRVVDRTDGTPLLTLPEVHLTVAWTSLLFVDLRFKEAVLDRPQLAVRRDAQGILHVAGLTFDPDRGHEDSALADWMLRQRRILIHDGTVTWRDEQRDAPSLELKRVEFRMENRFGRHRFGLTGTPPPEIAAPIDLRGDVTGRSLAEWRASSGRLYARLDYADVAAWRTWLSLPFAIKSGKGAVRIWMEYADGEARAGVADLVLADVQATLAPELQELSLSRLDGRVGWRIDGVERQFFTEHLAFSGPGASFDPTDFKLVLRAAKGAQAAAGQIEFSNLQLAPLTQVAENLPLPERWRHELAHYNPRGTLAQGAFQWQGEATAPESYVAKARFTDLGVDAQERIPGVKGLSGNFDATEKGGSLKLSSRAMLVDLPHVFAERLAVDTLQGHIGWERKGEEIAVALDGLVFANAQVSGTAGGTYRIAPQGQGTIDLDVRIARADVRDVYRYVPVTVPAPVRDWLRRALVAGTASDARLQLSGNLADFPFADGKKGKFLATVKAQGVTLDYAEHWPMLTDLDGDVRFEGARVTVDAHKGQVFNATLSRTKAEIANLRMPHAVLRIDGEASGPTEEFLRFVAESPVAGWIDHFTDGAEATGAGKLALKLELPLGKPADNRVAGEYTFAGNRIKLAGGVPVLNRLNGKLAFSGHNLQAPQLTADVLGGPARFTITSDEGQVRVVGQGSADVAQLRVEYPKQPLAKRISGTTDWQLAIVAAGDATTWTLDSNLRGAAIDLPPPMSKVAADAVALHIERHSGDRGHDAIVARYGSVGQLTLQRRLSASGAATLERGLLALGGTVGEADRPGLWVRGRVDALNVDGWLVVKRDIEAPDASDELPLASVDVMVRELDVFGRRFNELRIGASHASDTWQIDLRGRELAGTARWQAAGPGRPNGRIVARLQRLTVPATVADAAPSKPEAITGSNPWPDIDIVSDSFLLRDRDLGRLELTAQPLGADWQIRRVQLTNDDGKLSAQGWWRAAGHVQQTTLDAELDVSDAGRYLARFGLPDAVRGAASKIRGQVAWAGGPQAFDYPTLSGTFSIQSGQGQFTKLDPGAGKLLGVLSLQSLQRRLTLDFRDLFGEGFAFDEVTGDVRIQNGVMTSDNLRIVGPAARVAISGEADIARETQQLKVRVQPTLSASLSVGAGVLLLANPIIGAAVAAGSLLAQKVLQDPFEQMFSYEYAVSGSWSDPIVERTGAQASGAAGPAGDAGTNTR